MDGGMKEKILCPDTVAGIHGDDKNTPPDSEGSAGSGDFKRCCSKGRRKLE